jgi:hypothetical protein
MQFLKKVKITALIISQQILRSHELQYLDLFGLSNHPHFLVQKVSELPGHLLLPVHHVRHHHGVEVRLASEGRGRGRYWIPVRLLREVFLLRLLVHFLVEQFGAKFFL